MLELLLTQLEMDTKNDEFIRENFRRIEHYLRSIGADKVQQINIKQINAGTSPTAFDKKDEFTVTFNGQTQFTLSFTPSDPTKSQMMINGVEMRYGDHYTIAGKIVTFIPGGAGFSLELVNEFGVPDRVAVQYFI